MPDLIDLILKITQEFNKQTNLLNDDIITPYLLWKMQLINFLDEIN